MSDAELEALRKRVGELVSNLRGRIGELQAARINLIARAEQAEAQLAEAKAALEKARLWAQTNAVAAEMTHDANARALEAEARAEAEGKAMREALESCQKALKPFANAVYNDNGDMTVSPCHDGYESFIAAYFADRKARAALRQISPVLKYSIRHDNPAALDTQEK